MNCSLEKKNINETAGRVREVSYNEKIGLTSEQIIDSLLDKILDFKKSLRDKIKQIKELSANLEEMTWYDINVFDEETKKKVNDVIIGTKDWVDTLNKHHALCISTLDPKVQVKELTLFKDSIDDLEEIAIDLEELVFNHSHDEEFIRITNELRNL
ncbi:hypothetical protein ACFE6N_04590 [Pedobacter sp. BG31]|uniref:hypothetical protein n=1 Tax=Pedobacter sp. BG31 TaxID=3349697 RepID=UPI0035F48738